MKRRFLIFMMAMLICLSGTGILAGCSQPSQSTGTVGGKVDDVLPADSSSVADSDAGGGESADTGADTGADTDKDTGTVGGKEDDVPPADSDAGGGESADTGADTGADTETTEKEEDNTMTPAASSIANLKPKDGKALRIAFIGDSITEGTGSSNKLLESYPAQLQSLLGNSYVVGNFGKAGSYVLEADSQYNEKTNKNLSYRNTAQYTQSLSFGADVVVIILGINDIRSMSCNEAIAELKAGLISLANEYKSLSGVQKVYIGTSIAIANCTTIYQFCYGPLQNLQKEVARECGLEVLDFYSMTRDYLNVMLHYTADKVHPNAEQYSELARAMYCALLGLDFVPTSPDKSQSGVVYVKTGGKATGLGATPETAIDSLAKAVGLLRDGGGTIVVCGKVTIDYETLLPHSTGKIKITSSYGGVDWAKTNGAAIALSYSLFFYGDYEIDDINIIAEKGGTFLTFNYNDVTIGKNVVCSLASGIKSYPLLLVGHSITLKGAPVEQFELRGECNVTVNGGTWAYIRGGNRRSSGYCAIASSDVNAKLNITINGGRFTNTADNLCTATGMSGFAGECVFTINGGTFLGDVYAVSRVGSNLSGKAYMSGKITMKVLGGTFNGKIGMIQDPSTITVTGTCSLVIASELKDKATGFTSVEVI